MELLKPEGNMSALGWAAGSGERESWNKEDRAS